VLPLADALARLDKEWNDFFGRPRRSPRARAR
jgi:hypothetical protein